MAVHIQSKGSRGVTEISLHRFDIVSVLERQDSVGVPKIMHSGVRCTDGSCQLFEMGIDSLGMKMPSKIIGEHKSGLPLFFIFPTLPFRTAFQAVFHLFVLPLPQNIQHIGRRSHYPHLVVLQRGEHKTTFGNGTFLELLVDG